MAALRDIARDVAEEIRDGIGWVIVYRTGRSWSALTLWSDLGSGEWETDDLNDAIGILKTDPDAVVLNGYYCGHFGEGMTIDEIALLARSFVPPYCTYGGLRGYVDGHGKLPPALLQRKSNRF